MLVETVADYTMNVCGPYRLHLTNSPGSVLGFKVLGKG